MNVLLVGSGGREHALAWKAAQSARLTRLWVAPGNAGTARLGPTWPVENISLAAQDTPGLVAFALAHAVDLVIIGPEGPLAAGLADALRAAGVSVFGPSAAAAQIEASKAFSKAFMDRHHLPTARYAVCEGLEQALAFLHSVDFPVVIKASGLAAGKGVILPGSAAEAEAVLRRMLLEREFGPAGETVVIEERLAGPEVSLLAFSDGVSIKLMPPAQDHKNLLDGDQGPNTGGMGAYAPAPVCPPALADRLGHQILQPAIDGLRAEGRPFVGVLYAGLMLTPDGPRLLEFNCRFGDPETQAILPLLDTDLLDVLDACGHGRLAEVDVRWQAGAAACVVLASQGYPGASPLGRPIHGLETALTDAVIFHAGTQPAGDQVVTAGGRVLGVTGWGDTLAAALAHAYAGISGLSFQGQHYRRDIGHQALETRA